MNLIVPEDEKRRMNYVKLIGKGEVGYRGDFKKSSFPEKANLEEWCRVYCEDSAGIKQFVPPLSVSLSLSKRILGLTEQ